MMQVKRNIKLLIMLAVLLVLTAANFWYGQTTTATAVDKTIFKVQDLKSIDEISLESKTEKVDLQYRNNHWMVNDRYPADRHLIDLLFATLEQAEPKRLVAASLRDSLNDALEQAGVKVSMMTHGSAGKIFYAGGNAQKTQAYFKETGKTTSYVMNIPGYRVYTSGIFELTENEWREKRVFNFNWRNFKTLQVNFPADPKEDFTVAFIDRYFGIVGLAADTTKLNNYLDAVSLLQVSRFGLNSSGAYDSLLKTSPAIILEVKDVSDKPYMLALYKSSKQDRNMPGKLNEEPVLFNRQDLSLILKGRSYFMRKP